MQESDPILPSPEVTLSSTPFFKNYKLMGGILGVVILLILTLLTLNYFNIISLKQFYSRTLKSQTISNIPQKVKNDMAASIRTVFQSSINMPSLEIEQIKPKKKAINQSPNQFRASWDTADGNNIGFSTAYNDQLLPEERSITVLLPRLSSLSATSSAILAKQYLIIQSKSTWKCSQVNLEAKGTTKATICEAFWVDSQNVKHGVGVMSPATLNSLKTSVFTCDLYPESKIYSWKSCSIYTR